MLSSKREDVSVKLSDDTIESGLYSMVCLN
jgi:hypothetical protein